jgi:hypothetical protein
LRPSGRFTRSFIGDGKVLLVQCSVDNRLVYEENDLRVWTARRTEAPAEKAVYVAIINLGDQAVTQALEWSTIELHAPDGSMRDLWTDARWLSSLRLMLQRS